ncbi:MAG: nucleoside deaminase [Desulfamplus sp.]|nr:nucleoside deaminase [Desulfamplus sp.]
MTCLKDRYCKKDEHYMGLALAEASKAFDQGEFPVGCVIIFNNTLVASGSRRGTASLEKYPSEIYHAEIRALQNFENSIADRTDINIIPEKCTLYSTMEPCLMCFGAIILSGIKHIVYAFEDPMGGGTSCDLEQLSPLYRESDIRVVPHILRDESLELFARFFSKKDNAYWKNSLLEEYTLKQAKIVKSLLDETSK